MSSLALDPAGNAVIAYVAARCLDYDYHLHLARDGMNEVLYRGVVADLTADWKAAALPTGANDDPTGPFPVTTRRGGGPGSFAPGHHGSG